MPGSYGFHLIHGPFGERARAGTAGADQDTARWVFMTYDDLVLNDRQLLEVFNTPAARCARDGALRLTPSSS